MSILKFKHKDNKDGKTWFFCMENAKMNNL